MARRRSPPPLIHATIIALFFSTCVQSQVQPADTFTYVNEGAFGDYVTEYDASYRIIYINGDIVSSYRFQLFLYNTTPGSYVFAVRAGLPRDESLMRWVWDANRGNPVGENATLSLHREGNLVLAEADGRVSWQTNTANKGVTGMRLLPNGNLVLHDKKGNFVWQSFDHPVDTLLVGMSLKLNGVNKLVSRTSDANGSDGPYNLVLDKQGLIMYYNNSGNLLRYGGWAITGSNATFDARPETEAATAYELIIRIESDAPPPSRRNLLQSRPIGSGYGTRNLNKVNYNATLSFLRIGHDGNLKAFTYYDPVTYLKWEESFAYFSSYFVSECLLPSKCGSYGLCQSSMCVACPSPKGLLGGATPVGRRVSGAAVSLVLIITRLRRRAISRTGSRTRRGLKCKNAERIVTKTASAEGLFTRKIFQDACFCHCWELCSQV